ncbi:MAG: putative binding protein component of ABC iron transporter [Lysobacteraceae bacterium]|nr:MAG: putative binding protein component of ABC iron transporter [Xanthomonadaceae bacterium]
MKLISALALLSLTLPTAVLAADELVVYSERKDHLIRPLLEQYSAQTGVEVRFLTDSAGVLIERIAAEGTNTPADLFLTVDAGSLWQATERGLLVSASGPNLQANIPDHLADPEGRWYGLSMRARTVVYSTERVDRNELGSYADLADAKWQGRLCLRTSKKVYNQSLVAMLINANGEQATEQMVRGWVANLAAPPFSNDTSLIEAIAAGQCDVGIVNTYYLGRLLKDDPTTPVTVHWPPATHINISGGGVVANSDQKEQATALLDWLASDQAQALFAGLNLEYPADPNADLDPLVEAWGTFDADQANLSHAGRLQAEAVRLMDRAGYR